jgi:hemerythrin superfamily protein
MNGIELIEQDHQMVNELFAAFDESLDAMLVGRIVDALTLHDQAEHAALYPLVDAVVDPAIAESAERSHAIVKRQIDIVTDLEGDSLIAQLSVLRELVEAHVAEEETEVLPALAAAATPQMLDELGSRILQAKQRVG